MLHRYRSARQEGFGSSWAPSATKGDIEPQEGAWAESQSCRWAEVETGTQERRVTIAVSSLRAIVQRSPRERRNPEQPPKWSLLISKWIQAILAKFREILTITSKLRRTFTTERRGPWKIEDRVFGSYSRNDEPAEWDRQATKRGVRAAAQRLWAKDSAAYFPKPINDGNGDQIRAGYHQS